MLVWFLLIFGGSQLVVSVFSRHTRYKRRSGQAFTGIKFVDGPTRRQVLAGSSRRPRKSLRWSLRNWMACKDVYGCIIRLFLGCLFLGLAWLGYGRLNLMWRTPEPRIKGEESMEKSLTALTPLLTQYLADPTDYDVHHMNVVIKPLVLGLLPQHLDGSQALPEAHKSDYFWNFTKGQNMARFLGTCQVMRDAGYTSVSGRHVSIEPVTGLLSTQKHAPLASMSPTTAPHDTKVTVLYLDVLECAQLLAAEAPSAIVSTAAVSQPGVGALVGDQSLEAELCRRSTLYPALRAWKLIHYPLQEEASSSTYDPLQFALLTTENVLVFKEKTDALLEEPFSVAVLSLPSLDMKHLTMLRRKREATSFSPAESLKYVSEEQVEESLKARLSLVLTVAWIKGIENLALSSRLFDQFRPSEDMMGEILLNLLTEAPYKGVFKRVCVCCLGDARGHGRIRQMFSSLNFIDTLLLDKLGQLPSLKSCKSLLEKSGNKRELVAYACAWILNVASFMVVSKKIVTVAQHILVIISNVPALLIDLSAVEHDLLMKGLQLAAAADFKGGPQLAPPSAPAIIGEPLQGLLKIAQNETKFPARPKPYFKEDLVEVFKQTLTNLMNMKSSSGRPLAPVAKDSTSKYVQDFNFKPFPRKCQKTAIHVLHLDTLEAAAALTGLGRVVAVLNMANSYSPGGGVKVGATAQEENLCRRSDLYAHLLANQSMYPLETRYGSNYKPAQFSALYTRKVQVFKDKNLEEMTHTLIVDVVSTAALDLNKIQTETFKGKQACVRMTDAEVRSVTASRIRHVFNVAAANQVNVLVMGAFGCGAFGNDAAMVSSLMQEILDDEFDGVFEMVVFAVLGSTVNFSHFHEKLGARVENAALVAALASYYKEIIAGHKNAPEPLSLTLNLATKVICQLLDLHCLGLLTLKEAQRTELRKIGLELTGKNINNADMQAKLVPYYQMLRALVIA